MKVVIPDASTIATAILESNPKTKEQARDLLIQAKQKKIAFKAPSFLKLEFANAIRFYFKKYEQAKITIDLFSKLPIEFVELSPHLINQASSLSYKCKTSVYDAAYHALAIKLDAIFVTADKKYYNKAKDLGNIELIS